MRTDIERLVDGVMRTLHDHVENHDAEERDAVYDTLAEELARRLPKQTPPETMVFTAANGVKFLARILRPGDGYGKDGDGPLRWGDEASGLWVDEPGVEFYDTRHPHTKFGQFTGGRYYIEAILEGNPMRGINLARGVDDWTIDGPTLLLVKRWLSHQGHR